MNVTVCGIKFVGVVLRLIIIGFFLVVIIPFKGVLVRQRVTLSQPAVNLELLFPKGVPVNVYKGIRVIA